MANDTHKTRFAVLGHQRVSRYELNDMRTVLRRLGVAASPVEAHHHHFHIYLRPPEALVLRNLEDVAMEPAMDNDASPILQGDSSVLMDFIATGVPTWDAAQYVHVADASPGSKPRYNGVYEICEAIETQIPPAATYLSPGAALFQTASSPEAAVNLKLAQARVTVLEQPKHGVVTLVSQVDRHTGPIYRYVGNDGVADGTEDRVVFLLEVGSKRFKVIERLIFGFNTESIDCKGKDFYVKRVGFVTEEMAP